MPKFTDATGDVWDVSLTLLDCERVLNELGINIATMEGQSKATTDMLTCAKVLWIICAEQAIAKGLSAEKWLDRFFGETVEEAARAFEDAIINFTQPSKRTVYLRAKENQQEMNRAMETATLFALDQMKTSTLSRLDTSSEEFLALIREVIR